MSRVGWGGRRTEWLFRSSLDRFVWIFGMLCAWAHPYANAALEAVDGLQLRTRVTLRAALLAAVGALGYAWCAPAPPRTLPKRIVACGHAVALVMRPGARSTGCLDAPQAEEPLAGGRRHRRRRATPAPPPVLRAAPLGDDAGWAHCGWCRFHCTEASHGFSNFILNI